MTDKKKSEKKKKTEKERVIRKNKNESDGGRIHSPHIDDIPVGERRDWYG